MSVDDIVKLLLAISLSVSLVGICIQLMRLIGKLADTVQDARKAVQNLGTASDMMLEDYGRIRKLLNVILNFVEDLEENLLSPMQAITRLLRKFNKKDKTEEVEKDDDSTL